MNRHFVKYYFYFLARLLDLFGQYDKSFSSYSKVIRIRTFFWDVQSRYNIAYQKSTKNSYLEIHGGIGDFLQHLPFLLENKFAKYIVITHFKSAKYFMERLGIKVSKYYFYNSPKEHLKILDQVEALNNIYPCPRKVFFEISPFALPTKPVYQTDLLIGLHFSSSRLTSSPFNISFSLKLIQQLLKLGCSVVLFGTKNEIAKLNIKSKRQVIFANDKDIIKNLSLVKYCDLMIGCDSAFKTMSSMLKIQTLVFLENNNNRFRDRVFINPYVINNIMTVYKYKDLHKEEKSALNFATYIIRNKIKSIL